MEVGAALCPQPECRDARECKKPRVDIQDSIQDPHGLGQRAQRLARMCVIRLRLLRDPVQSRTMLSALARLVD